MKFILPIFTSTRVRTKTIVVFFITACRITAVGCEFSGTQKLAITKRKCLAWSEKKYRKYLAYYENKTEIITSERALWDDNFPERSRADAGHNCRNPTNDVNGPWCLVEERVNKQTTYMKEYCEVEFCEVKSSKSNQNLKAYGYELFVC